MRNELIKLSKNAELLRTNKVSVTAPYVRKNGDPMWHYRLSFCEEPYKTTLYGYEYPNGVVLRTVPVKREAYDFTTRTTYAGHKTKSGVKLTQLSGEWLPGREYINIFREQEGVYVLMAATAEEAAINSIDAKGMHLPTGTVSRADRVTMTEFHGRLYAKKAIEMEVDLDRAYLRLTPVEESSLPFPIQLQKMYGNMFAEKLRRYKVQMSRAHFKARFVQIPSTFARKHNIQAGDILPVWQDDDGSIVIEAKPVECQVTGKPLRRYEETVEDILVRNQVAEAMTEIKANLQANKRGKTSTRLKNVRLAAEVQVAIADALR